MLYSKAKAGQSDFPKDNWIPSPHLRDELQFCHYQQKSSPFSQPGSSSEGEHSSVVRGVSSEGERSSRGVQVFNSEWGDKKPVSLVFQVKHALVAWCLLGLGR